MSTGLKITVGVVIVLFAIGLATLLAEPQPPKTIPKSDAREAASNPDDKLAAAIVASVEQIDCQRKHAPKWCAEINYVTDSERAGTLVMVIRSDAPGDVHWCTQTPNGHKYIGPAGNWVSSETLNSIGARAVTLVPRIGDPGRFIVLPPGSPAPEYLSPCPAGE